MFSSKLFFWSLVSAMAGFLFGFDTVVISGAEKTIQSLWHLSDALHGLAMGSAIWGTVLGAMVGSWPTDRYGRRPTLILIGVLFFVSAVWSGIATDVYSFIIARFIGGLGIGISTVASPLYISEIAPAESRGWLAGLFQFNIVFGILAAFISNAMLAGVGEYAWRWMMGAEAFPALAYLILSFRIPESPRWLVMFRGDRETARRTLAAIYPEATPGELDQKIDSIAATFEGKSSVDGLRNPKLRGQFLMAFLIAAFNQLSGINAILYYAPRIFEMTGLGSHTALLQSVGIGVTNLVFTMVGLWLIDRVGRRTLMYIGSVGYILSLGLCAWAFSNNYYAIVPYCIFAFIGAHAIGQGAVIWVFIGEIFPNQYRAWGQSVGCFTHWIFAALLTTLFPLLVASRSPADVFLFFTTMMVLQLFWVHFMMPETKGVSLESIQ